MANSAVTSLSLDGEEIPLSARGGFDATVIVEEGQNAYHVVAKDAQGNVLADEYKLIYMSFGSNISARFYPTCYPDQMDELRPARQRLDLRCVRRCEEYVRLFDPLCNGSPPDLRC